jgi:hypothetical protein
MARLRVWLPGSVARVALIGRQVLLRQRLTDAPVSRPALLG